MARVVVVGSGIAGLAAAIRLARQGHEVTVFEQQPVAGGKIAERYVASCRFDAGPSLLTWPQLLDELFALVGKSITDWLPYRRLPVICHYFFSDGKRLKAHADVQRFSDEVHSVLGVAPSTVKRYLNDSARLFHLTREVFLTRSLHDPRTFFTRHAWQALLHLPALDAWTSLHRRNVSRLHHPHLVQLFDRYATYNGSDPFRAPATLKVIPHLEFNEGAYLPENGMYAIIRALYQLAITCGVRFHFSTPVRRIRIDKSSAVVEAETPDQLRGEWPADLVVSNADVQATYEKLLSPGTKRPSFRKHERSTSALVFFWEMDRRFPELGLHNIFFSSDYRNEFAALRQGAFASDVTVYVNISCKEVPTDAPAGKENWFVLVNAPARTNADWPHQVAQVRRAVLQRLSRCLGSNVADHIAAEAVMTPADMARSFAAADGALYGNSSNHWHSAFLRHSNSSSKHKNLYFCGGSVHPGGGIPLCLLSARITAGLIARRRR